MDDEKIKARIGSNIASFRKAAGLTQAGLAEKLNYSDKAISKWERGESVPDVLTLMQLGQLFGVTMDALVSSDSPAGAGLQEPERPTALSRHWSAPLCGSWPCFSSWSSPPSGFPAAGWPLSMPFPSTPLFF